MSDRHPAAQSAPTPPAHREGAGAKKPTRSVEDRLKTVEEHVNSMLGVPMGEDPIELLNSEVLAIPITATTDRDKPVALPAGDTFTATSSDPGLHAGIGADKGGGPVLVVRPMKQACPVATVVVTDSRDLRSASLTFSVVPVKSSDVPAAPEAPDNPAPARLVLDIDKATKEPQMAPSS